MPQLSTRLLLNAYQKQPSQQKTDTSHEKGPSHSLDHMDGPWMGLPEPEPDACLVHVDEDELML